MVNLQIDDPYAGRLNPESVIRAAEEALRHQGGSAEKDLSVVITGDRHLREMNRRYLDKDAPTDVLSFPAQDFDPDRGVLYLGDILISYPQAEHQSKESGHSLMAEIQLLVVHGVLHLLGFDHHDLAEKERMWAVQAEILSAL